MTAPASTDDTACCASRAWEGGVDVVLVWRRWGTRPSPLMMVLPWHTPAAVVASGNNGEGERERAEEENEWEAREGEGAREERKADGVRRGRKGEMVGDNEAAVEQGGDSRPAGLGHGHLCPHRSAWEITGETPQRDAAKVDRGGMEGDGVRPTAAAAATTGSSGRAKDREGEEGSGEAEEEKREERDGTADRIGTGGRGAMAVGRRVPGEAVGDAEVAIVVVCGRVSSSIRVSCEGTAASSRGYAWDASGESEEGIPRRVPATRSRTSSRCREGNDVELPKVLSAGTPGKGPRRHRRRCICPLAYCIACCLPSTSAAMYKWR